MIEAPGALHLPALDATMVPDMSLMVTVANN